MSLKTFFLQNQQTNTSRLIQWSMPNNTAYVDLQPLLQNIAQAHSKLFKIYSAQLNSYLEFQNIACFSSPYTISKEYLRLGIVMIKYRANPHYQKQNYEKKMAKLNKQAIKEENSQFRHNSYSHYDANNDEQHQNQQQNKKQRSKQRNIREVIEVVQKWRQFHDSPVDGKRRTLQEAASLVGVSKKSLDDYYYQLRVGEKYDFDFHSHLQQKIGVLRAFIKQKDPQRRVQGKNSKHPKKLKIIEEFTQKLMMTENNKNSLQNSLQNSINPLNQNKNQVKIIEQPPSPLYSQTFSHSFYNPFNEPNSAQNQYIQNSNPNFRDHQSNEDQIFWGAPFNQLTQQKFNDFQQKYYDNFGFLQQIADPYMEFLPFNNLTNQKSDKQQHQL